jgi:hypothetical protein
MIPSDASSDHLFSDAASKRQKCRLNVSEIEVFGIVNTPSISNEKAQSTHSCQNTIISKPIFASQAVFFNVIIPPPSVVVCLKISKNNIT